MNTPHGMLGAAKSIFFTPPTCVKKLSIRMVGMVLMVVTALSGCSGDNGDNDSPWNKTVSNLSPSDGMTLATNMPRFSWNAVPDAAGYQVQFSDNLDNLASSKSSEVSAASYMLSNALEDGKTYYWRVRAMSASRQAGPWCDTAVLKINSDIVGTPILWNEADASIKYQVEIGARLSALTDVGENEALPDDYEIFYACFQDMDGGGEWSSAYKAMVGWGEKLPDLQLSGDGSADTLGLDTDENLGDRNIRFVLAAEKAPILAIASDTVNTLDLDVGMFLNEQTYYWHAKRNSNSWGKLNTLRVMERIDASE